jgi:hypothetical protein
MIMFANESELVTAIKAGKRVYSSSNSYSGKYTPDKGQSPEDYAREVLENCRAACLRGSYYGKRNNRPWQLVDFSKELSASSPWVGYEFEMGFRSNEDRQRTCAYMWDNINHSAQDAEGHGSYILEATFKPQNFEEYSAGTADILKLYKFFEDNKIPLSLPAEGTGRCGTHANISTPLLRKCSTDQASQVTNILHKLYNSAAGTNSNPGYRLNRAGEINPSYPTGAPANYFWVPCTSEELEEQKKLLPLNAELQKKFFGRPPYGWCNFRTSGHYIEFKIFASTAKPEKFLGQYMKTTEGLIGLIDEIATRVLAKGGINTNTDVSDLNLVTWLNKYHDAPVKAEAQPEPVKAPRKRKAVAA